MSKQIEISNCDECGHFPTQYIAVPGGTLKLHLPEGAGDDHVSANIRELALTAVTLDRQVDRLADSHHRLTAQRDELLAEAEQNAEILAALLVRLEGFITPWVVTDIRKRIAATEAAIAKAGGAA